MRLRNRMRNAGRLVLGSAGGSWTPANLAGVALRYVSGPAYEFTDAGGTTPVALDGDLVQVWKDSSGNGVNLSQATAGNRPVANLTGATWRTTGDGTAKIISNASASVANNGGLGIAIAFLPTASTGATRYLMRLRNSGIGNVMTLVKPANDKLRGEFITSSGTVFVDSAASITTATPCAAVWSVTAALAYTHRLNGVQLTGTLAGTYVNRTADTVNVLSDTSAFWDGSIYEIVVATTPFSAADILLVEAYFRANYGTP